MPKGDQAYLSLLGTHESAQPSAGDVATLERSHEDVPALYPSNTTLENFILQQLLHRTGKQHMLNYKLKNY